jgi:fatty-acid peroxygenase
MFLSRRLRHLPRFDRALLLARHGYLFTASLSANERRTLDEQSAVAMSFLGRPALLVSGRHGVEVFYDEKRVVRHRAVPAPIAASLFGPGAVHGLDDAEHRHRKSLFLHALRQEELDRFLSIARRRWRVELERWRSRGGGEAYESAVFVFGSSIIEWAGIDEPDTAKAQHARWMADIVDGFGVPGSAFLRAAVARQRCNVWASGLIRRARTDGAGASHSWVKQVAFFVDQDGSPLDERTAAVELLNILRPTVAVAWLAAFAVKALEEHPDWGRQIRAEEGDRDRLAEAFAHEVRRYYPFVPVLAARARENFEFAGHTVLKGQRIVLDVYGTNHGAGWPDPWAFDPGRFLESDPCTITQFIPQGGGPRESGHRCPGEGFSNGLLAMAISELAQLDRIGLPVQDQQYSLRRMPTRPASGIDVGL